MGKPIISTERIAQKIVHLRGQKVLLVKTRALKQAIRRNSDRFPADFMFEL